MSFISLIFVLLVAFLYFLLFFFLFLSFCFFLFFSPFWFSSFPVSSRRLARTFSNSGLCVPRTAIVRQLAGSYRGTTDNDRNSTTMAARGTTSDLFFFLGDLGTRAYLRVYAYVYYVYSYVYIYIYLYIYICICILMYRYIQSTLHRYRARGLVERGC